MSPSTEIVFSTPVPALLVEYCDARFDDALETALYVVVLPALFSSFTVPLNFLLYVNVKFFVVPSEDVAVAFTVTVESATLPCPRTTLAEFVNVLTGPLSTEYVPLTAFFNVSVIVCVSDVNNEPLANEVVTFGSLSGIS